MSHRTLQELAALCGASLEGDSALRIKGPAALLEAEADDISFYGHVRYAKELAQTRAKALVVPRGLKVEREGLSLLRADDANRAFERVLEAFDRLPSRPRPGVHPSAVIGSGVVLGDDVAIGAGCVLGDGVRLGVGVALHPGVVLSRNVTVGDGSELRSGVVAYDGVTIGARCLIHAGAVIGSDGFGFDPQLGPRGIERWNKAPHAGTVVIEDDVEIGANTCIDRGRFSATRIGRGAKLDNLVHVGHNVQIGEHALLIAQVGIAGSSRIGRAAILAGQSGVSTHLEIGDGARIGPASSVFENVPAGADYMGYWARPKSEFMRTLALERRLGEVLERLKRLEKAAGKEQA
ncbi:MAG: UDP-3-O-(3-hydroxymyristoyl)glucosamine N-acyltransferase [Planctomycetota bacterium]|nr:UDP-3-O-(3-hydroxymyristoyl)glucosamine N-acyltransferase [Planctomycetota bacterium]